MFSAYSFGLCSNNLPLTTLYSELDQKSRPTCFAVATESYAPSGSGFPLPLNVGYSIQGALNLMCIMSFSFHFPSRKLIAFPYKHETNAETLLMVCSVSRVHSFSSLESYIERGAS